jgi:hypothetical protein
MAVYSMRRGEPILPTTAAPVWTPMPTLIGVSPRSESRVLKAARAMSMSVAAANAASA